MKLVQMKDNQFMVTLPIQLVRAKGWSKGDKLRIEINKEGDLVIKK